MTARDGDRPISSRTFGHDQSLRVLTALALLAPRRSAPRSGSRRRRHAIALSATKAASVSVSLPGGSSAGLPGALVTGPNDFAPIPVTTSWEVDPQRTSAVALVAYFEQPARALAGPRAAIPSAAVLGRVPTGGPKASRRSSGAPVSAGTAAAGSAGGTLVLFTQTISGANAVGGRTRQSAGEDRPDRVARAARRELHRDPQPAGDHAMRIHARVLVPPIRRRRSSARLARARHARVPGPRPLRSPPSPSAPPSPNIRNAPARASSSSTRASSRSTSCSRSAALRVTEQGEVVDAPLDTTRVHVKLSAMSFRIPPRGTYTVFYEATADSLPAWFNILSAMTGARTESGLNLRILLPARGLPQPEGALRKEQVAIRALEVDSAAGKLRVQLENLGPNLGRVQEVTASAGKTASPPVPASRSSPTCSAGPSSTGPGPAQPERLSVRFAKFTRRHRRSPRRRRPSRHGTPSRVRPSPRRHARSWRRLVVSATGGGADGGRGAGRRLVAGRRLRRHRELLAQRRGRLGRAGLPGRAAGRARFSGPAVGKDTAAPRQRRAGDALPDRPLQQRLQPAGPGRELRRRHGRTSYLAFAGASSIEPGRALVPGHRASRSRWARSSCSAGSHRRCGSPATSSSPDGRRVMPGRPVAGRRPTSPPPSSPAPAPAAPTRPAR